MKKYLEICRLRKVITALNFGNNRPEKQKELKAQKQIIQERIKTALNSGDTEQVKMLEKRKQEIEEQLGSLQ